MQVPVFWMRQILLKVAPWLKLVLSGTVTSVTKVASSVQPGGFTIAGVSVATGSRGMDVFVGSGAGGAIVGAVVAAAGTVVGSGVSSAGEQADKVKITTRNIGKKSFLFMFASRIALNN